MITPLADLLRELRRREAAVLEQEIVIQKFLRDKLAASGIKLLSLPGDPHWMPQPAPPPPPVETTDAEFSRNVRGAHIELGRRLVADLNGETFDLSGLRELRRKRFPKADWFNPWSAMFGLMRRGEVERCEGGFRKV